MNRIAQLIERIGTLQRSEMRRFALNCGLQMVHLEVLGYLARCNRYSDTTQALSEYLGQTKGSISQTVAFLDGEGLLKKTQDSNDKRIIHLKPTAKGRKLVDEFELRFYGQFAFENLTVRSLEQALANIQKQNGERSFGICANCRFNTNPTRNNFVCGLTGATLHVDESKSLCREYKTAIETSAS